MLILTRSGKRIKKITHNRQLQAPKWSRHAQFIISSDVYKYDDIFILLPANKRVIFSNRLRKRGDEQGLKQIAGHLYF